MTERRIEQLKSIFLQSYGSHLATRARSTFEELGRARKAACSFTDAPDGSFVAVCGVTGATVRVPATVGMMDVDTHVRRLIAAAGNR
jgi:hypothetical protein